MVRVSDFLASFISDQIGVRDVFMLSGAGIMHLTDGVACNPRLRAICVHHEQSASMAVEAYARANENFGVAYFTTGPGATNAITGLAGAWQDTVPCLFISGQVKRSECSHTAGVPGLRQFGVQELDIIPIVSSICKSAVHLTDPTMIRYELEKAVHIAKSGRPGPVWIEIPMDVQAAKIDPTTLKGFEPPADAVPVCSGDDIASVADLLAKASRPVIIAGRGVRLAGAQNLLRQLAETYSVPVVTPYLGIDNIRHDLDVYIGKTGVKGDRPANFAMQNSDLVLAIGTSLHVSVIGYEYGQFAREATKVVVDIDKTSHLKKTFRIDRLIESDAKAFLASLIDALPSKVVNPTSAWLARCVAWKKKYPVVLPEYADQSGSINIYTFIDALNHLAEENDVFVADAGSAFYAVSQAVALTKEGQRYIPSGAMATMGYSLPAAIGVSAALGGRRVLAITGDGSFQQNLQELQTVLHYNLPVKLFVLNNDGYLSIRASQNNYFNKRLIGEGPTSGVTMPDTLKLCEAYGMPAARVSEVGELNDVLRRALAHDGPYLVDVICPPEQAIVPTVSSRVNADGSMSSRPLEDMAPFLDREEYRANLMIPEV